MFVVITSFLSYNSATDLGGLITRLLRTLIYIHIPTGHLHDHLT